MNAVLQKIKEYLSALPSDVCEEVESRAYNKCGWPEAPDELQRETGFRWWPQIVQLWFGSVKVADPYDVAIRTKPADRTEEQSALVAYHAVRRARQLSDNKFESVELAAMTSQVSSLVLFHSCGNPRCVNPRHVINPAVEPERATAAVNEQKARLDAVRSKERATNVTTMRRGRRRDLQELAQERLDSPTRETKEELFNASFKIFRRKLFLTANRVFTDDAEAAVQEAFLSLWSEIDSAEYSAVAVTYPAWAMARLQNDVKDYAKSQRRKERIDGRRVLSASELGVEASAGPQEGVMDDWNPPLEEAAMDAGMYFPSAEEDAISAELEAAVEAFLDSQTPEVRELYESCVIGDTPVSVYARQAGVPRATVFRWRKKLESDIRFVVTGERVVVGEDAEQLPEPRKSWDAPLVEQRERIRRKHREMELRWERRKEAADLAASGDVWTPEKSAVFAQCKSGER